MTSIEVLREASLILGRPCASKVNVLHKLQCSGKSPCARCNKAGADTVLLLSHKQLPCQRGNSREGFNDYDGGGDKGFIT
jgi:hypothetical protein